MFVIFLKKVSYSSIPVFYKKMLLVWKKLRIYKNMSGIRSDSIRERIFRVKAEITLMKVLQIIIVAFLENASIGYSLKSVCVCVCASMFVCVCVCFCTITQKEIDLGIRNRNTL